MTDRILFNKDGLKVSKPGFDVNTASEENLLMYPGMSVMTVAAEGTVTIPGGQRITVNFSNPNSRMPYIHVSDGGGGVAHRTTFCAETQPPYNFAYIRNDVQGGAPTRTITYCIMVDNSYIPG